VEPGVVEEVVVVVLAPDTIGLRLDGPGWDRLPGEFVVHDDGQPKRLSLPDVVGDLDLERSVSPFVLENLDVVDPHSGPMGGGIEPEDGAHAGPAPRNENRPLVPDVADVVVDGGVHQDIVVAARHRHLLRAGQRALPPALLATDTREVDHEVPDSVEPFGLSHFIVLGSKH
jgi:hypothetical protein